MTDYQFLILYMIDEGEVWCRQGEWFTHLSGPWERRVTWQVSHLATQGLIELGGDKPQITDAGMTVLKRRSIYDVIERLER